MKPHPSQAPVLALTILALLALSNATQAQPLSGTFDLANADVVFQGSDFRGGVGFSVSSAGDFNGDGYDDVIIGSPFSDLGTPREAGEAYLLYGGPSDDILPRILSESDAGVRFKGTESQNNIGFSVSSAGDVNNDGLDDLLIGTWPVQSGSRSEVYLIYGRPDSNRLTDVFNIDQADATFSLDPALHDLSVFANHSFSLSSAGDLDGDSNDDFLIGSHWVGPNGKTNAGETYLYYGRSDTPFLGSYDLASADATFAGLGTNDKAGWSVSAAGDINNDNYGDFLIGSPGSAGKVYLVLGREQGKRLQGAFDLLNADSTFSGKNISDQSGRAVSAAGDINGDGLSDFLISAPFADPSDTEDAGEVYLIYGRENTLMLPREFDLADADVVFKGAARSDFTGISIAPAGDVNGDGLDDLLIGAHASDPNGMSLAGVSYLVYGKTNNDPLPSNYDLITADVIFHGPAPAELSGFSLSSAGDYNGDGLDDILIGAYRANSGNLNSGTSYIVFGRSAIPEPAAVALLATVMFALPVFHRRSLS